MSQPITITNKTTLQQELMAVASSLNMCVQDGFDNISKYIKDSK